MRDVERNGDRVARFTIDFRDGQRMEFAHRRGAGSTQCGLK
jgi:hypothetical protein